MSYTGTDHALNYGDDARVVATAPNGELFTSKAIIRGYRVRYAVLGERDGAWFAVSWHVDASAADRKAYARKTREAYANVVVVNAR